MTRPAIEVADILRARGRQFLERFKAILSYQQLKAYRAVLRCRTAALGGHKDKCVDCAYEPPISYNSCLMGSNFLWRAVSCEQASYRYSEQNCHFQLPITRAAPGWRIARTLAQIAKCGSQY
jgi:predicted RNA-binding Zn-ribbon protein involved in translation (DUF1610 family)